MRQPDAPSAKPNVLVLGPLVPDLLEPLSAFSNPVAYWKHKDLGECRRVAREDFRGLVSTGESQVPREFLNELPSLEIIANFGVGYDGIDLAAAAERGIRITNTPDVLTEDVADYIVALTLAARRRLLEADRHARSGRWESEGPMGFTSRLNGKRVGIAGLGRIGRATARRLEAFGCDIGYFDVAKLNAPYRFHDSLVELARESDILILCMPGGGGTNGAVNREVLSALGREGSLVNASRGSVVDEKALIEALRAGDIATAALDVFASEPSVPEALKKMSNVVLSPHNASATRETRNAMRDLVIENLRNHFEGRPLKTPVS